VHLEIVDAFQRDADSGEDGMSARRDSHGAPRAHENTLAAQFLHRSNLRRHRRLTETQCFGSARKALQPCDGIDRADLRYRQLPQGRS
jgi:hypothetical protein